jgi:hypothetical protein
MEWQPATIEIVKDIVRRDVERSNRQQVTAFREYSIDPYLAPIVRYGKPEQVVIVARKGNDVIYWDDVEDGFCVSRLGSDGVVLDHCCNQDELGVALNGWIEPKENTR